MSNRDVSEFIEKRLPLVVVIWAVATASPQAALPESAESERRDHAGASPWEVMDPEQRTELLETYLRARASLAPLRLPETLRDGLTLRILSTVPKEHRFTVSTLRDRLGPPDETRDEVLEGAVVSDSTHALSSAEISSYRYGPVTFHTPAGEELVKLVSWSEPWQRFPAPDTADEAASTLRPSHRFWDLQDLAARPDGQERLVEALTNEDQTVRRHACLLLGEVGDTSVVPRLLEALDDPVLFRCAASALARLGDERAVPSLAEVVAGIASGKLRGQAYRTASERFPSFVEALAHLGGPESHPALLALLNSRFAVDGLPRLFAGLDPPPTGGVIQALENKRAKTRAYAAAALGWGGDDAAADALRRVSQEKKGQVAEAARQALARLENKHPADPGAWRLEMVCEPGRFDAPVCRWGVVGDVLEAWDAFCMLTDLPVSADLGRGRTLQVRRQTQGFSFLRGLGFELTEPGGSGPDREYLGQLQELVDYCRL